MKKKDEITTLIQKYLEDSCSTEELDKLIHLLNKDGDHQQVEGVLYSHWKNKSSYKNELEKEELDEMLALIHQQIIPAKTRSKTPILRSLKNRFVRAAAILFIPLLLGTLWLTVDKLQSKQSATMVELATPSGSKIKTTLPDGTEVWQNAGTVLRYPSYFSGKGREVELIGEAYFHVVSDENNPFYVQTKAGKVKVTGTRFNLSAYEEDAYSSVVLEEGEVVFLSGKGQEVRLLPDEQLVYTKQTGALVKQKVDVEKYTAWTKGKLIFRNDPLSEVVQRLERWFHADIELLDPDGSLAKHTFTLTIEHETLPQVLNYITQAADLSLETRGLESSADSSIQSAQYRISKHKD